MTLSARVPAYADPEDRAPVEAPFMLSRAALDARDWLVGYYGVSEADALGMAAGLVAQLPEVAFDTFAKPEQMTVQGTLTLARGALAALDGKAREHAIPRDRVLEAGLTVYALKAQDDKKKRLDRHREALYLLSELGERIEEYEEELKELLGGGDPILARMAQVSDLFGRLVMAVEDEQDEGTPVEPAG